MLLLPEGEGGRDVGKSCQEADKDYRDLYKDKGLQIIFAAFLEEYCRELRDHSCGWGISFHDWLEGIKGWKHVGCNRYQHKGLPYVSE